MIGILVGLNCKHGRINAKFIVFLCFENIFLKLVLKISFSLYKSFSSCLAPKVATNCYLLVRYEAQGYTNEVNNWFSLAIGRTCCLLRYSMSNDYLLLNKCKNGGMRRDMQSRVTFANEAQFLLISEDSVSDLNNRISSSMSLYCFHL